MESEEASLCLKSDNHWCLQLTSGILFCFHFQVFAGVYPVDQSEHLYLRSAIEKLTLNDSSVSVNPDSWYGCIFLNP